MGFVWWSTWHIPWRYVMSKSSILWVTTLSNLLNLHWLCLLNLWWRYLWLDPPITLFSDRIWMKSPFSYLSLFNLSLLFVLLNFFAPAKRQSTYIKKEKEKKEDNLQILGFVCSSVYFSFLFSFVVVVVLRYCLYSVIWADTYGVPSLFQSGWTKPWHLATSSGLGSF